MGARVIYVLLLAVLGTMLVARSTHAEESPWVKGTTLAQRTQAQTKLEGGNALLLEKNYVAALAMYREAIAFWDHPAIRFNIVRCLIQLDRPIEAVDELDRALRYGAAPLEENIYNEALAYKKLLASQIGTIKLSCSQEGVRVTIDGAPIATCPAKVTQRVSPGRHQLVGEKDGLATRTMTVVVVGATEESVSLTLEPVRVRARVVHRFATWIPWAVLGGGALTAGVGGLVQIAASNDNDTYRREIARTCSDGCSGAALADLRDLESRARLESNVALAFVGTGIAAVIAGGVLMFVNRGRTVYQNVEVSPTSTGGVISVRGAF